MRTEMIEIIYYTYEELQLATKIQIYGKYYTTKLYYDYALKTIFCDKLRITEKQITKFSLTSDFSKLDVQVNINLANYLDNDKYEIFGTLQLTRKYNQGSIIARFINHSDLVSKTPNRINLTQEFAVNLLLTPASYNELYNVLVNTESLLKESIQLVESNAITQINSQLNHPDVLKFFKDNEFYYDNNENEWLML